MHDDTPVGVVLAETIAWCLSRADPEAPATCLRTARVRQGGPGHGRETDMEWVAWARRHLDPSLRGIAPVEDAAGLRGGRLLVFLPDESLFDGAADEETGGYFDTDNCPPWDTWVALTGDVHPRYGPSTLVSWVPPVFVPAVERGIYVNPEECLLWLEDSDLAVAPAWARYA